MAYIPDKNTLTLAACYYCKPQRDKKYLRPAKIQSDREVERTGQDEERGNKGEYSCYHWPDSEEEI